MGCSESKQEANTEETTKVESTKYQPDNSKSENGQNFAVVESVQVKHQNVSNGTRLNEETNISSHGSFEVIVTKKEKPRPTAIKVNQRRNSQRLKPKELSQVQPAWGRKSTAVENNFLEDLRLLRDTADKNRQYENDYETFGEDTTSRFVNGKVNEEFEMESSHSDVFKTLTQAGEQEDYFDASKIIDVEKFRAANVTESKQMPIKHDDKNVGATMKTNSSNENHKLHSSFQDITTTNNESFTGLYNEDDKDLIESIEYEFSQENYHLPGQIIN